MNVFGVGLFDLFFSGLLQLSLRSYLLHAVCTLWEVVVVQKSSVTLHREFVFSLCVSTSQQHSAVSPVKLESLTFLGQWYGSFVFAAKSQHPFVRHLPPLADVTQAVRLSQQTLKERDEVVMKPHRLSSTVEMPVLFTAMLSVMGRIWKHWLHSLHSPNIMSVG